MWSDSDMAECSGCKKYSLIGVDSRTLCMKTPAGCSQWLLAVLCPVICEYII